MRSSEVSLGFWEVAEKNVLENQPVTFGRFRLEPRRGLWRGQQEVKLAPKALDLLRFLLERAGDVITKDEVFRAVWPDTIVSDGALTSCIRELRKAAGRRPAAAVHRDLHRRGYRFIARSRPVSPPAPSSGPLDRRSPAGENPSGRS